MPQLAMEFALKWSCFKWSPELFLDWDSTWLEITLLGDTLLSPSVEPICHLLHLDCALDLRESLGGCLDKVLFQPPSTTGMKAGWGHFTRDSSLVQRVFHQNSGWDQLKGRLHTQWFYNGDAVNRQLMCSQDAVWLQTCKIHCLRPNLVLRQLLIVRWWQIWNRISDIHNYKGGFHAFLTGLEVFDV